MENAKDHKEQAKLDREEQREQVEFNRRQCDQHYKMEMVRHQAILNQGKLAFMQEKEKIKMSLQRLKGHSSNKRQHRFRIRGGFRCIVFFYKGI